MNNLDINQLIKVYRTNKEELTNEIGIIKESIRLHNTSEYPLPKLIELLKEKTADRRIWITVLTDLDRMGVQNV